MPRDTDVDRLAAAYRKIREGRERRAMAPYEKREREEDVNWAKTGAQGAAAGSAFGPWGTLVGGIIGSGVGMARGVGRRLKEGQGLGTALGRTAGDVGQLFNRDTVGTAMQVAPILGARFGSMGGRGGPQRVQGPGGMPPPAQVYGPPTGSSVGLKGISGMRPRY